MCLNRAESPFTDRFLCQEVEFYGHPAPSERHGLTIDYVRPRMRCDDYLNVNMHLDPGFDVPALFHSQTLWMSLTWMEVQSQWVPILMARGRAATVGLGLGYFVLRVLDQVEHLTVYEKDDRVIKWFVDTHGPRLGDRVTFVHGDAREVFMGQEFDFVYADPYDSLCQDEVIGDIEFFNAHNHIGVYRFWGQELVKWRGLEIGCVNPIRELDELERHLYRHWQQSEGSQLRSPTLDDDYVEDVCDALRACA